jgi:hypothetical protein
MKCPWFEQVLLDVIHSSRLKRRVRQSCPLSGVQVKVSLFRTLVYASRLYIVSLFYVLLSECSLSAQARHVQYALMSRMYEGVNKAFLTLRSSCMIMDT